MASELRRRLTTAAVALPPVVALLWFGGWPFAALASAASLLACREFLLLAIGPLTARDGLTLVIAAVLPWVPLWAPGTVGEVVVLLISLASFCAWAWHVARQDIDGAVTAAPWLVQALVFCAVGPLFVSMIRLRDDGREWSLALVAATFANDSSAYAIGRWLGRHRIAPRVSPGKTWEGAAGGALGAALIATLAVAWRPDLFGWSDAVVLAVVCSTLGPLGDFAKSALKRARGVKDAGRLLPGHGGLLDRIDALIVNAPVIWAWLRWGT